MRKSVIKMLMAAVLVLLPGRAARAELITIQIEAIVYSVQDEGPGTGFLNGQVSAGNTITGYYLYESTTPDSSFETWLGKYQYAQHPYGMVLDVGGLRFETNPQNVDFTIGISNNRPSMGDVYSMVSVNNSDLPNGLKVTRIFWQLDDYSGLAIDTTSLMPPILDYWRNGNLLRIESVIPELCQTNFIISAHVTSAIPEPSTVLLFGVGAICIRKLR